MEIIFSYVDECQKLKLIKYNKNMQNKMRLSIIHYKAIKGKFIEYISNGYVKEYNGNDDNKLLYEGEFLNGQRNGKGKELYSNGKSKFEGECLNGKGKEIIKMVN